MSEGEDQIRYETPDSESLTAYHQRKRAEAQLAALEKQYEIEIERSMRRWATAHVVAETIVDHPVAAVGVGLAGLWLAGMIFGGRRSR